MTVSAPPRQIRVAAYCRKSHVHGLDQEFNSIDAQRQAIEAFIASQRGTGWVALPQRYDDGGFSGATTDRPAFQRLLADVAAGKVDCIAVYRIDRLSRSFADYVGILKLFEKHGVTFVSVTEQFNTTTPTGRLVLNQLILFSQFEREVIGERIRDKVRATRARGAFTGGRCVLGFSVEAKKLVVNTDEAAQVRSTFQLYLEHGCIRDTVAELRRRGWRNKSITTRAGKRIDGKPFTKSTLFSLLTNPLYAGQIRCGSDLVPGAHTAIVESTLFNAVQEQLRGNGNGATVRNKTGALLRGIVRCARCDSAMLHTFTKRGSKRYGYYCCAKLHNEGTDACPNARVPAGKFEAFVVAQIRAIGNDENLLAKTAECVERRAAEQRELLDAELRRAHREQERLETERAAGVNVGDAARAIADRIHEVRCELDAFDLATEANLRAALAAFTPVWDSLFPAERERVLRLLIAQITYDPDTRETNIALRPSGIATLAAESRTTP